VGECEGPSDLYEMMLTPSRETPNRVATVVELLPYLDLRDVMEERKKYCCVLPSSSRCQLYSQGASLGWWSDRYYSYDICLGL